MGRFIKENELNILEPLSHKVRFTSVMYALWYVPLSHNGIALALKVGL